MSANEYTQAMSYEMLIRNAFNCERGTRHGAELSYMQNAMTMEQGKSYAKHLGSFEKQFEKVKGYISKALIKLSSTRKYKQEQGLFLSLNDRLEHSTSTTQLMEIVNAALEKIIEIRDK
jgi:hypothetical protein